MGCTRLTYQKNTRLLKVVHSKTPFFLLAGEDKKPYRTKKCLNAYKYKYQGQERQEEFDLNWDSFKWRNYAFDSGRFMSIDPLAEEYAYNSPYAFQENKMGMGIELEGLELYDHRMSFRDNVKLNYYAAKSTLVSLNNTAQTLINPTEQVKAVIGIVKAIASPVDTFVAAGDGISQTLTNLQSTDPKVQGTAFGQVVAVVIETVVGAELANLGKLSKVANIADDVANASTSTGGRLGNAATRAQNSAVADALESKGFEITGGGGRFPEEYIKPLGGGRKGGSYPDITATKNGRTLRVNTVDTKVNGSMTTREATNATRIRAQKPNDHLLTIPKQN